MRAIDPAEQLLQSLGVTGPAEIDIEAIAWTVGAKVRNGHLESCEARIIGFQDRAIITVKSDGDWRRRRFSIAHELGHWHYHKGQSSVCRSDEIGNPQQTVAPTERQADRFAANLLMPQYLFKPMVSQHKRPSWEVVDELATEFSTSRLATALRFVDLTLWPCVLVCHGQQGRRWFRRSKNVPDRWFPRDEIDADSSAMDVLYGRMKRSKPNLIGAKSWFDRREAERHDLTEQSTVSFDGDVLTLLTLSDEMVD